MASTWHVQGRLLPEYYILIQKIDDWLVPVVSGSSKLFHSHSTVTQESPKIKFITQTNALKEMVKITLN